MKKRIITCLLALCLLVVPIHAFAESDLSSMTVQELVELRKQIALELESRGFSDGSEIGAGVFVAGKDIKAGWYKLTVLQTNLYFQCFLFESMESFTNGDEAINNDGNTPYLKVGETYTIHLTEGMVMNIQGGTGSIQPISNATWAVVD